MCRSERFTFPHENAQGSACGAVRTTGKGRLAGGAVQPRFSRLDGKVGRRKRLIAKAPSNRPTSSNLGYRAHTGARAYTRACAAIPLRPVISQVFHFPLDGVGRLDEASNDAGFRRPTSPSNLEGRG